VRFDILRTLLQIHSSLFFIISLDAQQPQGEATDGRTMVAVRMNGDESIHLDGHLEEPVWQRSLNPCPLSVT